VTTQNEPSNGHSFRRLSGTIHTNSNTHQLANDPRFTIIDLGPPKNKVCFDENAEAIEAESDDAIDGIRSSEVSLRFCEQAQQHHIFIIFVCFCLRHPVFNSAL
jgi:hypothetical protein